MGRLRIAVAGGIAGAVLDIIDAFVFWGWYAKVPPLRIGQSIAGGVMGEAASLGGWASFALGIALHVGIAIVMALIFYAACRLLPIVRRHALILGAVYGVGLYAVMTYAVVPASVATVGQTPHWPPNVDIVFLNALFAHVVLVGLVIGGFTKRAFRNV